MATTTNFGWETPDDTDLVKDGAAAMRTLGNSIDTSFVDLKGGTTGQVLAKASATDLDYTWTTPQVGDITAVTAGTGISGGGTGGDVTITNSMATAIDAKGDLIIGTGADTFSRLAVGANNYILTADSTAATGVKWSAPAGGGGKVLQVIGATYDTATSTASASFSDTGLTATITPSASTSKILVLINQSGCKKGNSDTDMTLKLVRNGSDILTIVNQAGFTDGSSTIGYGSVSASYLDSPASTSALTYKTTFNSRQASSYTAVQTANGSTSTITLLEIGA